MISCDLVGGETKGRRGEDTTITKGHEKATIAVATLFAAPAHSAGSNPAANNRTTTDQRPQRNVIESGARA